MKTKRLTRWAIAPFLIIMMIVSAVFAGAETPQSDTDLLIQTLKNPTDSGEEHIIWEPIIREVEDKEHEAQYIQPEEGDLDQEEALRVALDTVFALTDLKMDTIFNAYQITFSFNLSPYGADRYWTVNFGVGIGKMGGPSYKVEVASPAGTLKLFEDVTT